MSHCEKEGKDEIIFVTKEDMNEPSKALIEMDDEDEEPGLILPNGDINWNCPCLGGMAAGPCGLSFREAFSCFHYSTADPKGSDCYDSFKKMQDCMQKYPEVYPMKDTNINTNTNAEEFAELEDEAIAKDQKEDIVSGNKEDAVVGEKEDVLVGDKNVGKGDKEDVIVGEKDENVVDAGKEDVIVGDKNVGDGDKEDVIVGEKDENVGDAGKEDVIVGDKADDVAAGGEDVSEEKEDRDAEEKDGTVAESAS